VRRLTVARPSIRRRLDRARADTLWQEVALADAFIHQACLGAQGVCVTVNDADRAPPRIGVDGSWQLS
jgi:hypothetical protein